MHSCWLCSAVIWYLRWGHRIPPGQEDTFETGTTFSKMWITYPTNDRSRRVINRKQRCDWQRRVCVGFSTKDTMFVYFPACTYYESLLSDCERQNERIPRGEEWIQHTVCLPLPFFDLFFGISQLAPWYASCSSNIRSRTMCTPAKPLAIREWINKMKRNGWVCVREGDGAISHGLCSIPQDTGGK